MRLGLAANRLHHATEDAALFRWLRASQAGIRELGLEQRAPGRGIARTIAVAGQQPTVAVLHLCEGAKPSYFSS